MRFTRRDCLALTAMPLIAASLHACSDSTPATVSLAPPHAAPLSERGVFDLTLGNVEMAIAQSVGRDHGKLDFRRYRLDPSATAESVAAFYSKTLGAEWNALSTYPASHREFRLSVWQRRSLFDTGPVVAVAWLEDVAMDSSSQRFRPMVVAASR
jgi:hypothetical protein